MSGSISVFGVTAPEASVLCGAALAFTGLAMWAAVFLGVGIAAWVYVNK